MLVTTRIPAILLLASAPLCAQEGFWERRPRLNTARQEVGGAVLAGSAYVAGGLDVSRASLASMERLDPGASQWVSVAPMPTTRHHFGMASAQGRIWVVGGYRTSSFTPDDGAFVYDPGTNQWTAIAPLPRPRGALVAVEIGGKVYAVGGVTLSGVVGDLDVYDPATNQWTSLPPMPTAREHLAAAAIGGKLYAAGGRVGFSSLQSKLEVFDPVTNQWSTLPDMPTARGGNGAAAIDGELIVVGGEGSAGNFPEAEAYDPVTNTWRALSPMSVPLHGIQPVAFEGSLLVAGGATQPGFAASDVAIAWRPLPDGTTRVGVPTPSCGVDPFLWTDRLPAAGDAAWNVHVGDGAPPSSLGATAIGVTADPLGIPLFGATIHLDANLPIVTLPIATAPGGSAIGAVPLPPGTTGLSFAVQLVFVDTPGCGGAGTLSASDALEVTIR